MFKKTCRCCGKTFETKRYPSVFCSQSCYFKYKRAAANEKPSGYAEKEYNKGWILAFRHFEKFVKGECRFGDINEKFYGIRHTFGTMMLTVGADLIPHAN